MSTPEPISPKRYSGSCMSCGHRMDNLAKPRACVICAGTVVWDSGKGSDPPQPLAVLTYSDPEGVLRAGTSVHCNTCGYNLVDLSVKDPCPECGEPVLASTTTLFTLLPTRRSTFFVGINIARVGYAGQAIAGIILAIAVFSPLHSARYHALWAPGMWTVGISCVAVSVGWFVASFAIRRANTAVDDGASFRTLRWASALRLLGPSIYMLAVVYPPAAYAVYPFAMPIIGFACVTSAVAAFVMAATGLVMARRHLKDIGATTLAARFRWATPTVLVLSGIGSVFFGIGAFVGSAALAVMLSRALRAMKAHRTNSSP